MDPADLSNDVHTPRTIGTEEAISRQIDRIAYLRSMGHPWSEAVYQLRDMAVGLEDEQFWDGVPPNARAKIMELDDPEVQKEAFAEFAELGWSTHSVRAFNGPRGPIFRPSAVDLSKELRIILGLLERKGMRWKTRRSSTMPMDLVKGIPES